MPTSALLVALGAVLGAGVVLVLWLRDRQGLASSAARLEAERDAALQAAATERESHRASQAQMSDAFAALSRAALKDNRDDFLLNAQALLTPVRQTLDKVQTHLNEVDKAREGSFQAVASQLGLLFDAQKELRGATEGLSRSLGSPNIRGTWGEIQLRRIVELAGMVAQCDFAEKQSADTDNGRQTPDLIIRLPGHATIVVDSKVPIQGYRAAANARDDATRQQALAAHARQVRDHIRTLGAKDYWRQFQPAPEFVVMFLPLEPLLQAAFEQDDSLFDLAASMRVIPATPLSLLALLKAVASGWRQQELAQNAEELQLIGRDLYERLATMVEHLENVGRGIQGAAESYDKLVGSLEQRVLPGARRFKSLGVTSTDSLDVVEPLRVEVRSVSKPELLARAEELIED